MKRPLSVAITAWLFIIAGATGFFYHFPELRIEKPLENDALWVLFVRMLAIAGGILMLRGLNIGRWLILTWMVYHVILSFFHTGSELLVHAVFLAALIVILFHPRTTAFFRGAKTADPGPENDA